MKENKKTTDNKKSKIVLYCFNVAYKKKKGKIHD